jgi:acyl-CoA reductase-like NAD-dependent aldehyde dehydrogenase
VILVDTGPIVAAAWGATSAGSASRNYVGTPFGGLKSPGIGREECVEELLSFTETKAVHLAYS